MDKVYFEGLGGVIDDNLSLARREVGLAARCGTGHSEIVQVFAADFLSYQL